MSWIPVSHIRTYIFTNMSDEDLQNIIDVEQSQLEASYGTTTEPSGNHKNALLYFSLAATLMRMKTNGELPEESKIDSKRVVNKISKDISTYIKKAEQYKLKLSISINSTTGSIGIIGVGFRGNS